ncbi:MAG: acyl-CoA dehydratase activase [Leptospiraceae bacterium]|nr:acyl-CoA dehydratase activase [Leptospiraceae bacterium]NUM40757.1 activase [Leptospiraceae bacterium]
MDNTLLVGIDVGSTTVKIAIIEPNSTDKVIYHRYIRHNASQVETVYDILNSAHDHYPNHNFRIAICGSGGIEIARTLGVFFVQEVVANSIVIKRKYPDVKTAIELGGQDAKLIFFTKEESTGQTIVSDMRMNGSCAGGTGAFIDQIADLLKVQPEEFGQYALNGKRTYDISGRCGVFAKTDIQPLLNQGVSKDDIALSVFHAIAKQTIGGLAQGMEIKGPVIFEGGPLTFNKALIEVFIERLSLTPEMVIVPDHPEVLVAYGAALATIDMFSDRESLYKKGNLEALKNPIRAITPKDGQLNNSFFKSEEEFNEFKTQYALPTFRSYADNLFDSPPHELGIYIGIDAGSTTSKFVFLDEGGNLVDKYYRNNDGEPIDVVKRGLLDLRKKYESRGVALKVLGAGSTGYGEMLFANAFNVDYHTVETVAHTKAAVKICPDVSFILDVGGQDMKAIFVHNGIPTNFLLNEACSAGCGSFLENYSKSLKIPIAEMADLAFSSKEPSKLGSRCTVFMNSSIITEQKNGKSINDIMGGLCRSVVENALTKVLRISNLAILGDNIVVQGGTFKNDAVLRAFQQKTGKVIVRPDHPGEMGAIGVALLTKEKVEEEKEKDISYQSKFITWEELENFQYEKMPASICTFCSNNCNRSIVKFSNNAHHVTGNRCEKGEIIEDPKSPEVKAKVRAIAQKIKSIPDMVVYREKLLFSDFEYVQVDTDKNQTIGIPRVLEFYNSMPFWKTFFRSLGYNVYISTSTSYKLFESGLGSVSSDTVCLPAKVVHGHVLDLIANKVDRIFNPMILKVLKTNKSSENSWMCPVIQGYSEIVRKNDEPETKHGIPYDNPPFQWESVKSRDNQIVKYGIEKLGLKEKIIRKAISNADRATQMFQNELENKSQDVLDSLDDSTDFAVILVGRPYHDDHFINHDLSTHFTRLGIPVLEVNALPGIDKVELKGVRVDTNNEFHTRVFSAALMALKNPKLEIVQVVSFGCGHDAIISDELERLLKENGNKMPLVLKLDEGDNRGPIGIRVKSFIETIQNKRKRKEVNAK